MGVYTATAKISGNSLKMGVEHSATSAQFTTAKLSARMSRWMAVEQRRYAAGMADSQGWQFETC